ncbi:unnamed protein product [Eruca vesicaria subsp. sativa]|uniref:Uncharacterized protein n=1 Tax=Eruca vesicaria subsp. sativa TaxID=29727 RepID=A0ABC8K5K9_ERUVS|nr:unnamed protein product [Eruca vesicaria subsp. sativa]
MSMCIKVGGPAGYEPAGHGESEWRWAVIRPLQREGGDRCSVKPASRIALPFRNRQSQAFAQHTRLTLSLDWAAQNSATTDPTCGPSQSSTNLSSPLGLQALVTELDV